MHDGERLELGPHVAIGSGSGAGFIARIYLHVADGSGERPARALRRPRRAPPARHHDGVSAGEPFLLAQLSDAARPRRRRGARAAVRRRRARRGRAAARTRRGPRHAATSPSTASAQRVRARPRAALAADHAGPRARRQPRRPRRPARGLPAAGAAPPATDYRYAARCGPLRLVAVDTTDPGRVEGRLGAGAPGLARRAPGRGAARRRRSWPCTIRRCCWASRPGTRSACADADRAALGEIVAGHPHVPRIVAGHVHRAALGSVGGCPVFTCPSTWIQGRLDFAHPGRARRSCPSRRPSRCTSPSPAS